MKSGTLVSALLFFSVTLFGQEWQTDLKTAEAIAGREHKDIILVFQGSDWCAPCMKLEQEIWSTEAFQSYARTHYVMLKADFPRSKKNALSAEQQAMNNALFEKYNTKGYFPYVVILDAEGNPHGSTGYQKMSPEEYIAHLNAIKS